MNYSQSSEYKTTNSFILSTVKKIKIVNKLGGKCKNCGITEHFLLSLHHTESEKKDQTIAEMMRNRYNLIEKEACKCILLCENCHREYHNNICIDVELGKAFHNKSLCLAFLKSFNCEECGYNKCLRALDFHHKNKEEKDFIISDITNKKKIKNLQELTELIGDELSKCQVLCSNCHKKKHYNHNRFLQYKDLIFKKVNNYKEYKVPLNKDEVIKLFKEGKTVTELAKYFDTYRSTISRFVKLYS